MNFEQGSGAYTISPINGYFMLITHRRPTTPMKVNFCKAVSRS